MTGIDTNVLVRYITQDDDPPTRMLMGARMKGHAFLVAEDLDLVLKIAYMEPFQDRVNGATPGSG